MKNVLPNLDRNRPSKPVVLRFFELPVGARFEFRGHRYEKVARGFAADEDRMGNLFHGDTEVIAEHDSPWRSACYDGVTPTVVAGL